MPSLQEVAADPARRQALIDDCERTLDHEVHRQKGMIAYGVKKAYDMVGRLEGGHLIANVFDKLLDEFAEAVDPFYAEYVAAVGRGEAPAESFAAYLEDRPEPVAEALLTVTDRERDRISNRLLISTYNSLRKTAKKLVMGSVPALADMLARHVPEPERVGSGNRP